MKNALLEIEPVEGQCGMSIRARKLRERVSIDPLPSHTYRCRECIALVARKPKRKGDKARGACADKASQLVVVDTA